MGRSPSGPAGPVSCHYTPGEGTNVGELLVHVLAAEQIDKTVCESQPRVYRRAVA